MKGPLCFEKKTEKWQWPSTFLPAATSISVKLYLFVLKYCSFPIFCFQFNNEEPGTDAQIKEFINGKFDFHPDLYSKIDVNGKNAHPLWDFLKHEQHGTIIDAIKWNFTKFLVDKQGHVIKRFAPNTEPKLIEPDIKNALGVAA